MPGMTHEALAAKLTDLLPKAQANPTAYRRVQGWVVLGYALSRCCYSARWGSSAAWCGRWWPLGWAACYLSCSFRWYILFGRCYARFG